MVSVDEIAEVVGFGPVRFQSWLIQGRDLALPMSKEWQISGGTGHGGGGEQQKGEEKCCGAFILRNGSCVGSL